jgi:hypothetical protein
MRTVRTKIYKFNELSNEAKQKAIEKYRDNNIDYQFSFDEITGSVKKMAELFNLKFGREYTDLRTGHIEDNILQLSGTRLYKYLMNNYYDDLFTPKYIKIVDKVVKYRQFICKVIKGRDKDYTQIYSKNKRTNDCVLTGICYDNDILQPVYDFLKKPSKNTTFEDIVNDIESAISKTFRNEEEYINSDEYIIEEIEANDYEFMADGKMFN